MQFNKHYTPKPIDEAIREHSAAMFHYPLVRTMSGSGKQLIDSFKLRLIQSHIVSLPMYAPADDEQKAINKRWDKMVKVIEQVPSYSEPMLFVDPEKLS